MTQLTCHAEVALQHLQDYLHPIVDRLASFDATVEHGTDRIGLAYPFGTAMLRTGGGRLGMDLSADTADALQRLRELVTVAVQIYAKQETPQIVWQGALAGHGPLVTFRRMRVRHAETVTPHMRRVRLEGENLARYGQFGGMHVRMLFPTPQNPEPVWPVAGPNGLPHWPSEKRRPVARVYTIRHLDAEAGFMDVDFVVHGAHGDAEGVGANWAVKAQAGDTVGIMGPLGRPVRKADWYVLGCDETGLPAVSRILEQMPATARGAAFIEVADESERQAVSHPEGVAVHWIHRDGVPAGEHEALLSAVAQVEWPADVSSFGWFAAEAEPARKLREHWRDTMSFGRDRTLAVGYWRRGASGVMAG